jgi:alkylation response protein AidB-like acyl-CoA dehydrogenase
MGIRGSPTAQLFFEEMAVPAANRLGKESEGFKLAMQVLDHSRPGIAAQALGIAEGAFELARRYAGERRQFGKPIADFQGIQFMLADMATQIEAARALTYAAGEALDRDLADITATSSMAKLFASDTAMRVTTDAVQILGGYGYLRDFPAERMMRDAKITQIYEGTNEIQRLVIAREVLKEKA